MFTEKLTNEDFNAFAESVGCTVTSVKDVFEDKTQFTLELFNGAMGPQPFLRLTDFECKLNDYYLSFESQINASWRKFLFEKFGEEYKNELKKYMLNQVDELTK